jgi:hypothetical protein
MDNYTRASLHLMESSVTPNNRVKSRGVKVGKQPIRSQKSTSRPQAVRRAKHKEEADGKSDSASVMKETSSNSHPSDSIISQGAFLSNIDRPDEFWVLVGMCSTLLWSCYSSEIHIEMSWNFYGALGEVKQKLSRLIICSIILKGRQDNDESM